MKNLLLSLILLFSSCLAHSADYWLRQNSPTTKWLYKCSFPDSLNGWAAGDSGIIIHTTNGSATWTTQNSLVTTFIFSINFINTRLGWAVTDNTPIFSGSRILQTTNGGILWTSYRFPDSTVELFTVEFIDSLNGWAAGSQGRFYSTTNGGINWTRRQTDSTGCFAFPVFHLAFYNRRPMYAAGGAMDFSGVAWRTTNVGATWRSGCISPEPIYDIVVFDSLNAIGCGGDFEYGVSTVKTSNNGVTWQYDTLGTFGRGETIAFRTRSEGWIGSGFSGRFIYSIDTGRIWHAIWTTDTLAVYDMVFTDPFHGYAVCNRGGILKYNTAIIGIGNEHHVTPASFKLYQNYPNPFNASTKIRFDIPPSTGVRGMMKLKVFDVQGREVAALLPPLRGGQEGQGFYEVVWNAENFPSGIYFYKLTAGTYSESKKMVLIK